ncbi:hypothetical protein MRB53_025269 [Persea americana]|uniref:Uncharacterized protein n=1 Tax=Persea americana TaxID=3435 RepID=A0ACC2LFR4_PERAE|nr:hypothetical protein MRB53_025269 [Persea americana]
MPAYHSFLQEGEGKYSSLHSWIYANTRPERSIRAFVSHLLRNFATISPQVFIPPSMEIQNPSLKTNVGRT